MKRFFKATASLVSIAVLLIVVARVLLPLPDISAREDVSAMPADSSTRLGAAFFEASTRHPELTGIIPLSNGHDALASRIELARAAEQSLDVQYYIWHDDASGMMLLDALYQAAQRGVRVRLLLDDNGVPGLDAFMAALNAQNNFDIRLFNPSTVRTPKLLGYTFDFFRMNRRMHNKAMIVDGAVAIIGGRNIGDEYFVVGDEAFYIDLDVLAAGHVVPDTAAAFDDYWNSASVFELETIVEGEGNLAAFKTRVADVLASAEAQELVGDLANSVARFEDGSLSMEWTKVQLVVDDPAKGQGNATRDQLMITRLGDILGDVKKQLDLVSAYFVPGQRGTAYLSELAAGGADVRVLTNAMNTTDVLMVHAGYSRYRRDLLEADVGLYELKLRGAPPDDAFQINPLGLSGASLHAKTFSVDRERIFIGSFNFDPRSATLNCEMGFLIDSPTLASRVSDAFDGPLETVSYQPDLTPEGKMIWHEAIVGGDRVTYQEEPGATWGQQVLLVIIGLLPIEWML